MSASPIENHPEEPPKTEAPSLMQRVLRGSMWTVGGHVISQVMRLGSNLIISRLLFPEAFGLMALVYTFITGLAMLSDLGVFPNIVQSKRGDDPTFLNTAWTLNAIRGTALWLGGGCIAYPVSLFYNEPLLMWLLPVVGFTSCIDGFASTKWPTSNRNLDLKRLTTVDLGTQIAGILVMLVGAGLAKALNAPPNVAIWALAFGSVVSSLTRMILTHVYLKGQNNRFQWDQESLVELSRFGRWVFLSTLLTFFAMNSTNLLIPRLLGVGFLGVFSFAQNLSRLSTDFVGLLGTRVLFPSYSELVRDRPERLYPALKRTRIVLHTLTVAVCLIFVVFGKLLISIMYDPRYADAGWILQILALGTMASTPGSTYSNVLLAQGKTFIMMVLMGVQTVIQFAAMLLGYHLGGEYGVIIGIAAAGGLLYPFQAIVYARLRLLQPEVDLPVLCLTGGLAMLLYLRFF